MSPSSQTTKWAALTTLWISLLKAVVFAQYTLEDVALHSTNTDCWSAIHGTVYDVTAYAPRHPNRGGGADNVFLLCGVEGTSLYDSFHANNLQYLDTMSGIVSKGNLVASVPTDPPTPVPTNPPTEITYLTLDDIKLHAAPTDCWSSIYGKVYDLTNYAPNHPGNGGGGETVYLLCGIEGTSLYETFHGNNPQYLDQLEGIVYKGQHVYQHPTDPPTPNPTNLPTTATPSLLPSQSPSLRPSVSPSQLPSIPPSQLPSSEPSVVPTLSSHVPSVGPSTSPTYMPSITPSGPPSVSPTTWVPTRSVSPTSFPTETTFWTLEDVKLHDVLSDCWTSINNKVYNLTAYAPLHPANGGGQDSVFLLCGIEGTSTYNAFHGNNPQYLEQMEGIVFMGVMTQELSLDAVTAEATTPSETILLQTQQAAALISWSELARHNTPEDCWVVYYDEVYDVTRYAPNHPAGARWLTDDCGLDSTDSYTRYHDYGYLEIIQRDFLGKISDETTEEPTTDATTETPTAPPTTEGSTAIVTWTELAQHNTPEDCWVVYYDEVYDVTRYAPNHPAGARWLTDDCGLDSTDSYTRFHDYGYLEIIQRDFLGKISDGTTEAAASVVETSPPTTPAQETTRPTTSAPVPVVSVESESNDDDDDDDTEQPPASLNANNNNAVVSKQEMATHNSVDDCWVSYYGEVFDVTEYAPTHPGGASIVTSNCGLDDTESYSLFHDYDELEDIRQYFKGMLTDEPQATESGSETPDPVVQDTATESSAANSNIPVLENGMVHYLELQQHSTPDDCWVSYYNEVYDMTSYAPEHPPGSETITNNCGADGTKDYEIFHERSLLVLVKEDYLGELDTTTVQADADTGTPEMGLQALTMEEIAKHDNSGSCYVRYYNDVYDLTYYSHPSPPGQSVIYLGCGRDSTADFASAHPRTLLSQVDEFKIGWIESSSSRLRAGLTTVIALGASMYFIIA